MTHQTGAEAGRKFRVQIQLFFAHQKRKMQRWLNYTTGTKGLIHLTSQHNRSEWFEAGKLKIKTHTYNEANSQLDKASIDLEDISFFGNIHSFCRSVLHRPETPEVKKLDYIH